MYVDIELNFPSLATIQSLSDEQAENYVLGFRETLEELEELQNEQGEKYESTEAAHFDLMKFLGVGSDAYAALGGQCISGGFVRTRNPNGKCPRAERRGCAGAGQFRCPIIYGGACLTFTQRATKSCIASAPSIRRILKGIREDKSGAAQREWSNYETELKSYCVSGSRRLFCHTLRNRLDQVRRMAKVTDRIPAPTEESYTTTSTPQPRAPSARSSHADNFREGDVVVDRSYVYKPIAPPTAASGFSSQPAVYTTAGPVDNTPRPLSKECYSEVMIEGFKTDNGYEKVVDPAVAYRAFCQGDKAYMNSILPEIRRKVASVKARVRQRSTARGRMLSEDVRRVEGTAVAIENCARFINRGGRLPPPTSDTIEFNGNETRVSHQLGGGAIGYTMLQTGYAGVSLGFLRPPRRFCDYSFRGLPATSSPPANSPLGSSKAI